jgi:hypothetical protein
VFRVKKLLRNERGGSGAEFLFLIFIFLLLAMAGVTAA